MAHMQMEVEKHRKKKSPIAEIVSIALKQSITTWLGLHLNYEQNTDCRSYSTVVKMLSLWSVSGRNSSPG